MSAKTILKFYGKSGLIYEVLYSMKFLFRFVLEKVCFFIPISSLRVRIHRLRGAKIGNGVYIGHNVTIDRLYPDQVTIEDNCSIGDNTMIYAHANIPSNTPLKERYPRTVKPVTIGPGSWIMPSCKITPGVMVGKNSVVAIGSVVTKSVDSFTLVGGNPAKELKKIGLSDPPLIFSRDGNTKVLLFFFFIFIITLIFLYTIYYE